MIYLVPIEPLTERYTEQWYRKIPEAFASAYGKEQVTVIDGEVLLQDTISVGTFLDINSTTHYKSTQLQQISKMFQEGKVLPGDLFFFYDIEFWGIESVRLLSQMNNIPVKIVGFLHAASHTEGDAFSIAAPYQQYTEVGWVAALDQVYVGSAYAKQAFIERRLVPLGAEDLSKKIKVTSNPFFATEYEQYAVPKENLILLTNRLDAEKNPLATLNLFEKLKMRYPQWRFAITTGRKELRGDPVAIRKAKGMQEQGSLEIYYNITKAKYHELLSSAKAVVSHSAEESYGYCIAEAIHYGAVPFLLDAACHPEWENPAILFQQGEDEHVLSKFIETPFSPINTDVKDGLKEIMKEVATL